jgi:hypothetical protein
MFGYPGLYCGCQQPDRIEAHVVGSPNVFASDDLPDVLSTFNLREGLVCLNNQQQSGHCNNYAVRYQCAYTDPATGAPATAWTDWIDRGTPSGTDGDHELRAEVPSLCASPAGTPIAMQATTTTSTGTVRTGFAPNDQLLIFDATYGLMCVKGDQPNREPCSNYVVRFDCSQGIQACPLQ